MAFLPNLGGPAVSLLPLSIGYMQVAQLRFKRREQRPYFSVERVSRPDCRGTGGMREIVAAIFGK